MPRRRYEAWKPGPEAQRFVDLANEICADYAAQGYDLTLRQLYYQFVSRDYIENTARAYSRLGDIVNRARYAGMMDWDYIVDRTRNLQSIGHFTSPAQIMQAARDSYHLDKWANQPTRVEVWVEKEALAGVVEQVAQRLDVSYFSCRGYVSSSEQWGAAQRLRGYIEANQNVVVVHLGDHDPSGIDMTRDITDRITKFMAIDWMNLTMHGAEVSRIIQREGRFRMSDALADMQDACGGRYPFEVNRIALNMDQVEQYSPPPNFAKVTDSRFKVYEEQFGEESWELDALDPATLTQLIEDAVLDVRDDDKWDEKVEQEEAGRSRLNRISSHWNAVEGFLEGLGDEDDDDAEE